MPTEPQPQQRPGKRGMPAPDAPVRPRLSRMQRMQRDGMEVPLPELQAGEHLVGYLFEAGPTSPVGMGSAALAWAELQAWQTQVGIELEPWEVRTLRRLSGDFAAESRRAEAHDALAPMAIVSTERNRSAVAEKIRQQYQALRLAREHDASHIRGSRQ